MLTSEPDDVSQPTPRSRRSLLAYGTVITAGLAIGAAAEHLLLAAPQYTNTPPFVEHGAWIAIATVTDIAPGSVMRFTTPSVIGWLLRQADGSFLALSAVCTHMGCLVHWDRTTHRFECPCHHGQFDDQGQPVGATRQVATQLPLIHTRVQGNQVLVFVPSH